MNDTILIERQKIEFKLAVSMKRDMWVPACGGTETPFIVCGKKVLYCYNPRQNKHAYLDMSSDMIMSDEEYSNLIRI
jgi:hypothetical protein